MNINDILNGMRKDTDNSLVTKLEIKSEARKIDKRAEDLIESVMNFITDEVKFIDNDLSYSSYAPMGNAQKKELSEEDKKMLINKLKSACKEIPAKLEKEINEFFEDSDELEKKDDKEVEVELKPFKEVSVEVEKVPAAEIPQFNNFGY